MMERNVCWLWWDEFPPTQGRVIPSVFLRMRCMRSVSHNHETYLSEFELEAMEGTTIQHGGQEDELKMENQSVSVILRTLSLPLRPHTRQAATIQILAAGMDSCIPKARSSTYHCRRRIWYSESLHETLFYTEQQALTGLGSGRIVACGRYTAFLIHAVRTGLYTREKVITSRFRVACTGKFKARSPVWGIDSRISEAAYIVR